MAGRQIVKYYYGWSGGEEEEEGGGSRDRLIRDFLSANISEQAPMYNLIAG
jgi:hypothetical protein